MQKLPTQFNTKQEYLLWVSEYKDAYLELSILIRSTKLGVKKDLREMQTQSYGTAWQQAARGQRAIIDLKQQARDMLEQRQKSKKLASASYLKNLQDQKSALQLDRVNSNEGVSHGV